MKSQSEMKGTDTKMVFIKRIIARIFFPIFFLYTKLLHMLFPVKCYSEEETLERMYKGGGGALSRFGDGEINMIFGVGLPSFQDYDENLANRLRQVLATDMSDKPGFYVAVNPLILCIYKGYTLNLIKRWTSYNTTRYLSIYRLVRKNQTYYDALAFRIRGVHDDDVRAIRKRITEVKKIWQNKKILVIEGDYRTLIELGQNPCLGVNNDLLSGARSVQRIIAPAANAYSKYDEILDSVSRNFDHDLVILVLGMTATVLAYDLYKRGIRAIDFGQSNTSYIRAQQKYFANEPRGHIISEQEWEAQIIERIEE